MLKKTGLALLVLIGLGFLYLLTWPVGIDPLAWDPPVAPELSGAYAPNKRLGKVVRLAKGAGIAPESVAIDGLGNIYGGLEDGRIIRVEPGRDKVTTMADTGGRPLGLAFDSGGNLIVCDPLQGLLKITPQGEITLLTREADGIPLAAINDLDMGADGTIYFSETRKKQTPDEIRAIRLARPEMEKPVFISK